MDGDRIQEHLEKWGAVLLVAFAVARGISPATPSPPP